MIVAARAHAWTAWVHAVDSTGALCGARPRGSWRRTEAVPITCPRCLMRAGSERWALCETPVATSRSPLHIRRVGAEGISLSGNSSGSKTLCSALVGWDISELTADGVEGRDDLCRPCLRVYENPALASLRDAALRA